MDPAVNPPIEESMLAFYVRSIGPVYGALLMAAALVALVLTVALLIRGRGDSLAPALLLIVPLPLLVGGFAAVNRLIVTYGIIAVSAMEPGQSVVWNGLAGALVPLLTGFALSIQVGMLAAVVGLVRSLSRTQQL